MHYIRLSALAVLALALAACETAQLGTSSPVFGTTETGSTPIRAAESLQPIDDRAASAPQILAPAENEGRQRPDIFRGGGEFADLSALSGGRESQPVSDPVTLNFVDAEVRDVIRSVLGEMLGINYVIGEGVQGRITLSSANPIDRSDVLAAFETVLQLHGIALVTSGDVVQVVSEAQAQGRTQLFGESGAAGYGIEIVPLRYISIDEARRVLQPFASSEAIVDTDSSRNVLLLAGTRAEIDGLKETLAVFDVDWLSEMSFAMFYPEHVDVTTLAGELDGIFNRANSPISGVVELIPIERINALLAVSPRPSYFADIENWVERLDRRASTPGPRIHYYRAQNLRASDLADSLSALLEIDGGASDENPEEGTGPRQSRTRIVPDEENNALMIYATLEEYALIDEALAQIDIAPAQVLIEATIVEVRLTDELKYGVQWFFESDDSNFTLSDATSGAVTSAFPGFSYVYGNSNVDVALNALSSITDVNVLSTPSLMILNNRTGTLQVGDQVPVTTQSAVSVSDPEAPIVNSVQFRDTGVIFQVTPRINNSGVVTLEVSQEVSDVVETTSSGIDSPTIQQRKIDSIVAVQDGETVVLGGLIRETGSQTRSGIPLLMEIPLLGNAFRSNSQTTRRTELLIFITPHVAGDVQAARDVTRMMRGRLATVSDRLNDLSQ